MLERHPEKKAQYQANRRSKPDYLADKKKYRLKTLYNLSVSDYCWMLTTQNGVCAICKKAETSTWRGQIRHLAVDHDHKTGRIRGLLCSNCNRGLGNFDDSPEILLTAIEYLRRRNQ